MVFWCVWHACRKKPRILRNVRRVEFLAECQSDVVASLVRPASPLSLHGFRHRIPEHDPGLRAALRNSDTELNGAVT